MAERRMFARSVLESDSFVDMGFRAQVLYMHLNMEADDEGFVNGVRKLMKIFDCTDADLQELIERGFLISFDSGVVVITHWLLNNTIRKDRMKPTLYQQERSQLRVQDGSLYINIILGNQDAASMRQTDNQLVAQYSVVECSIDKCSTVEVSGVECSATSQPSSAHLFGAFSNVRLTMEEYDTFKQECPIADERIDKLSNYIAKTGKYGTVKSHLELLRKFWLQDKDKQPSYSVDDYDGYRKPVYKANKN